MTKKVLDANELLCDNNTVKTHQVNRSDFKKRLGFVDKIFSKKQLFLFPTVCKDVKANKERWTSSMTIKASDANEFLCEPWQPRGTKWFFNFKEWFIHDRERLIYDKIRYVYRAIFLLLEVRLISTSISITESLFFYHSHISPKIQTPYSAIAY